MKKTLKRILALALVVCTILSYAVPAAKAASWSDWFATKATYSFEQYSTYAGAAEELYDKDGNPVEDTKKEDVYLAVLGTYNDKNYLEGSASQDSLMKRYNDDKLNWTYEAASAGICGTTTELEHVPVSDRVRFLNNKGLRAAWSEGQWIAFRIKAPEIDESDKKAEFKLSLTFGGYSGSCTLAAYIMKAEGTAANDHDTVLARQEKIQATMDPDNRIGKVDLFAGEYDASETTGGGIANTAYIGNCELESNQEYIVVLENYQDAELSGNNYFYLRSLDITTGTALGSVIAGDPKVNAITVEKNVVPAADGGYMAAVTEVNGHDYYFRPLEGGKMAIFDLDKHVAGEESLVATVNTDLYYPTHATVTDDGRVIVGGDGKMLFIFDTKTMTGRTTPDFRDFAGLEGEGHNLGSHYGSDGYLYFASTYGGHLVQYDMEARTYLDLGDVITASVRELAGITKNTEEESGKVTATYYHNGYLYAKASSDSYTIIVKQDVANRKTVAAIDVTDQLHGSGVPHGITVLGDKYLIAGGASPSGMVLIDLATFKLVKYDNVVSKGLFSSKTSTTQDVWENGMVGHASEVINGKQYFYVNNVGLYSYDVATGKMARESTNFRGLRTGQKSTVTLDIDKNGTEETYIVTFSGSGLRLFNVDTKATEIISDLKIDASAVGGSDINIGTWYDDVLYIGAWNNWNCAAFDTKTEAFSSRYVTGGQTDSQTHYVDEDGNFHLISGNYSACVVYEIDPINKTGYDGDADSNIIKPLIANMKQYDQKRIHTVAAGDGYVFAGTIPESYVNGGGVGIYNTATETEDFIHFKETATAGEKCVPAEFSELWDLAVNGIVYSDGRLYGATTRSGGTGAGMVDGTSAQVFVMDYENMAIEATLDLRDYLTLVDVDGNSGEDPIDYVGGLSVDEQGRIWGIVSDVLFCFTYDKSSKTFTVQEVQNLGHTEYRTSSNVNLHNRNIIFDKAHNNLFVSFFNAKMQQVTLANWDASVGSIQVSANEQILSSAPETYTLGADNNLYYAFDTSLYMKPVYVTADDWTAAQAVDAQIKALGQVTTDSVDDVAAARAAYNNLSLRDKALVQESRTMLEAEAQVLELQIAEAIANVTADSTEELGKLILQYNELDASQQRYVQNYENLQTAYETSIDLGTEAAIGIVQDQIDALPDNAKISDEAAVNAVRAAYDSLETDLQAKIDPAKLIAAEASIANLKQQAADVQAQIDALSVETLSDEAAVVNARNAYDALTGEQQALVDTAKLVDAEAKIILLKEANTVQEKIDALPDKVELSDEAAVVAARQAYDALTDEQKALVDTTKLVSAESQIADIKAAAEVQAQIDALPDNATTADKEEVAAARAAYDALSDAQKALVDDTKLVTAEAQIEAIRQVNAVQAQIDALPAEVVIEDATAIAAARAAYEALAEELKAKVDTAKLVAAEALLAELEKNVVPSQQVYDFEIYSNPAFYTDCTKYTYDEASGRILENFNASKTYNTSTDSTIAEWFYGSYPKAINWGIETSSGELANYTFRGEKDQGMRLTDATTVGAYSSLRIFVPAAGTYTFDFEAGNVGINANVYVIPATTVYATARTSASDITAAMTAENLVCSINPGFDGVATAAGTYTFPEAGDYIVIFKAAAAYSKGISLRTMTLNPVIDETTAVAQVGDELFLSLDQAIAYQIENGAEKVDLFQDASVSDLVLESGAVLDLNGNVLTVDSVLTYSSSQIIDSSEKDTGVLVIKDAEGNMLSADNSQLPIYDAAAGGLRFFEISVKSVATTGKGGADPKYWFQVSCENFDEIHKLIKAGSELNITVKMSWNGGEAEAVASVDFLNKWADAFSNNESIYITVSAVNTEGLEDFSLIPAMAANGVTVKGSEM